MRRSNKFFFAVVLVFSLVLFITSYSNHENDIIGGLKEEKKHELINEENLASEKPIYQDESEKSGIS